MYVPNLTPQNKLTNKPLKLLISILLFAALLTVSLIASTASALKEDVEKPVHINADSVIFNKNKGFAVYEGNVSIIQGTLRFKAYRIEIKAPKNEIQQIIATGNPVTFQQKMDDGKLAKGSAKKVIYYVKGKKIALTGGASISQNDDKFTSNHIEYSTRTGELKAGKNKKVAGSKGRVKVIFYPSNKAK